MAAARHRYATVAIVLHWLIAAAIVFQVILGWRMGGKPSPTTYAIFQLHKSVGITILLLSLARLGWRLSHRAPPLPEGMPAWERFGARVSHWGFYVIMIGLPLTGWAMVSTSKTNIPTLLYGAIPWPHLPLHDLAAPAKQAWNRAAETGHGLLVWTTIVLLILHVGAALKHHFINRDEVLGHMAPGAKPGAFLEPRLWLLAVAGLAVIFAGYAYGPKARPLTPPAPVVEEQAQAPAPATPASPAATPAAAVAKPEVAPPVDAKPSAWTVADSSTLGFAASWGGQPIEGVFKRWKADIFFSPDALDASRLKVTVDVGSVSTGDAQRDSTLPTADWFDAAAHPQAVFTATSFTKVAEGRFRARGTLQLRGVTAPLTIPFRLTITGDRATATGTATIDRTKFGVGQGDWAATDEIAAGVTVRFTIKATRKQP
ncbi:MAG: hypothetical protein JWO33_1159 [Caulobacteraceae bacterium]|nr:hypothetical protein [Caulobacteraceae bacterium]